MHSAYYFWDKKDDCLKISTVGANGTNTFPAPIRPYFKCLSEKIDVVLGVGKGICNEIHVTSTDFIDLQRKPTHLVEVVNPTQVRDIRQGCMEHGLGYKQILEADIAFIRNWMLTKDVRCAQKYSKLYYDIEIWDKDGRPTVSKPVFPIISIGGVDHEGRDYFFTAPHTTLEEARANEKDILKRFMSLLESKNYGLNIGWYSGGGNAETTESTIDYPYISARLQSNNLKHRLSQHRWMDLVIPFAFTRRYKWKSTSLDYVSGQLFGKRKKLKPPSGRVADFTLEQLQSYNVGTEDEPGDVWLTKMIDSTAMSEGNGTLSDLMVQLAYEAHIFPDEVLYTPNIFTETAKPSRTIDALLIEEARRLKYALPSKPTPTERPTHKTYLGAVIVRPPIPGAYTNVLVNDIESLYPYCVIKEKISPDPDGLILPNILLRYLDKKRKARNLIERNAYKIILVASYGMFGSPFTRFYDTTKAELVTKKGKEIVLKAAEFYDALGYRTIYGDTDSVFMLLPEDPRSVGLNVKDVALSISGDVEERLRDIYGRDFIINMPPAMFASEIYFTKAGGGTRGAKKRYYAHVTWDEKKGDCDYYHKVGLEIIRSDQFSLLQRTQEDLLRLKSVGKDKEAEDMLLTIKDALLAGLYPITDLVISKGFGQENYKSMPPHVKVRDELKKRGLWNEQDSKVHFVWAKRGAVPYIEEEEIRDVNYAKYFSLISRMAVRADVNAHVAETKRDNASLDLFSS